MASTNEGRDQIGETAAPSKQVCEELGSEPV